MFWWQVVKLVRAIRKGWIKLDKPKEESNLYLLWGDETDTADNKRQGLSYIPAPKPNLPGIVIPFSALVASIIICWNLLKHVFT